MQELIRRCELQGEPRSSGVASTSTLDVTQSILGKDDLIAGVLNKERASDIEQTSLYLFRLDLLFLRESNSAHGIQLPLPRTN